MKKLHGFSQLEEARSWEYAARNARSFNRSVGYGSKKYAIF